METPLISLVCIAILVVGTVTMAVSSFQAASTVTEALKEMENQAADIRLTEIDAVDNMDVGDADILLTVENDGQTNLAQFPKWDLIAYYDNGGADYLTYLEYTASSSPGSNQWTVQGIYLPNNNPEAWDPDILNPGEKMVLLIGLNPQLSSESSGRITVSTPNGVTSQSIITRQ